MKCLVGILVAVVWLMGAATVWAHQSHEQPTPAQTELVDPTLLGFSGLQEALNVHPAFVHFPLALFPSAVLLYGLGILLKRPSWMVAGRACLYLATAGTALALLTGWQAQDSFPHNARIHHMMMTHLRIGLAIGVLAVLLTLWSFWHRAQQPRGAYAFLGVLALTTYVVLQNGDLGSRMVYVEGAAVKPAIPVIAGGQRQGHHDAEPMSHHHDAAHQDTPESHPPHTH